MGQQDFFASFAKLSGQSLEDGEAPDSVDVLPALLGASNMGREWIVEHARALSIRKGEYKLIEANAGPMVNANHHTEMGGGAKAQLYRLSDDPGETKDRADLMPEKVAKLGALLGKVKSGPLLT